MQFGFTIWNHEKQLFNIRIIFTHHQYLLYTLSLMDLLGDSFPMGHRSLPTLKTAVLDSKRKLSEYPSSRCCPFPTRKILDVTDI